MIGWVLAAGAVVLLGYEVVKRWHAAGASTTAANVGPPGPLETPPRLLEEPMHLATGQRYRFRFDPGSFDPTSMFANVRVYASDAELPSDWPTNMRQAFGGKQGVGTWTRPTSVTVEKPFGLSSVWPTASSAS